VDELESESTLDVEVAGPEDGTVTVRLAGELDLSNVERLEELVAPALAAGAKHLVIQAADLQFADSSAIALWVRWSSQVERFELRELSPLLRRVLTAMGLDQRLELSP
jgi:anti-anti-sigma factor